MRTIEITVDPKGNTRVETKGFTGESCKEASRFVEQALGKATGETLTAEYYRTEQERTTIEQRS
jgi:hypothetical protein